MAINNSQTQYSTLRAPSFRPICAVTRVTRVPHLLDRRSAENRQQTQSDLVLIKRRP